MVRFPFSSTPYVALAGRLGLAILTESMILFLSSSLSLLGSATSTFSPATGSYFLADSRTVILRGVDTTFPFLLSKTKVVTKSPAGCIS